jgi:transcription initiation factor TFIIB
MIGGFKDATGRKLTSKQKRRAWRLRKWQMRSRIDRSDSRNLLKAMNLLQILSEKLSIPSSVKEFAAVIYRKALDKHLTRGRTIAGLATAALYVACRFTKLPKTLRDLVRVSALSRSEISRNYRLLIKSLNMEMPTHNPVNYVSRIAEKTNISGEVQGIAVKILRKAKKKRIASGKDPVGLAIAALYIASQMKGNQISQKELAQTAGITEVTLRNRKKELVKKLDLTDCCKPE